MEDAGDGPGAVHRCVGDLVDDGVDVVSGELRPAERGVECFAGVFPLVAPRFVVGEPGGDLLVDVGVYRRAGRRLIQRLSRCPVPPAHSWDCRMASVAESSSASRSMTFLSTASGVACW